MPLATIKGDLFANPAEALVNPVNCVGVMGAGLAKQFKQRFKENYSAYRRACDHRTVAPGRMFVYDYGAGWLLPPRYIINFPTKRHYKDPSRMADIEAGLDGLRETIIARQIQSVSIPALGAGLGDCTGPMCACAFATPWATSTAWPSTCINPCCRWLRQSPTSLKHLPDRCLREVGARSLEFCPEEFYTKAKEGLPR